MANKAEFNTNHLKILEQNNKKDFLGGIMEYYIFLVLEWVALLLSIFTPYTTQFTILFFAFMLCSLIVSVTKNIIDPNASSVKIITPLSICAVK